jgi:Tfp pilus assembly protein PilF
VAGASVAKTAKLAAPNAAGAAAALPALPASSAPANATPVAPATLINAAPRASVDPNAFDAMEALQNLIKQLQMGQLAQAQASADRITGTLGRGHVMSLRAQGTLALHKGDLALAHGQYAELYQLLPDDREAGLNLALIEWRQGNRDSAARRIARLLEKFPNDQEIQALNLNMRNP